MKPGQLGHLYPEVEGEKCINCGLCKKKCPALNPVDLLAPDKAFAAWAKDEHDYKCSTSGGASSVFSQYVIRDGGVVYGCAVLNGAVIEHIRVEKLEDLRKIKGSKYVQSSIVKVLPQIKTDVDNNRTVLFIGTPCQVAAVKNLFSRRPQNLLLVDLVCHGTPSQVVLRNYLKRHVALGMVDNIQFRSERGYEINVFSNSRLIYSTSNSQKDDYLGAFLDGYSLRSSCFRCPFSTHKRCSDITIGDFWGLEEDSFGERMLDHCFGVSLILPITERGRALLNEVLTEMNVYERPIPEAIIGNTQLRHPVRKTKKAIMYQSLLPIFGGRMAYYFVRQFVTLFSNVKALLKK